MESYLHSHVYHSAIMVAKKWNQCKCSTDERLRNEVYMYKRNTIQPLKRVNSCFESKWMNLEEIMLSKINQELKDNYCISSLVEAKNFKC